MSSKRATIAFYVATFGLALGIPFGVNEYINHEARNEMKKAVSVTALPGKPAPAGNAIAIDNTMNGTDQCIEARAHEMLDGSAGLNSLTLEGEKLSPVAAACEAQNNNVKADLYREGITVARLVPVR